MDRKMTQEKIMLFDDRLRDILINARSIAILGAKDKAGAPVDHVGRYLMEAGYRIFPVHPVRKQVWGLPAYAKLADLPEVPDIVCLFRAAQYCPDHAREVLALPSLPKLFWMQEGIVSEEAGQLMADAGVMVMEDKCLEIEHKRLFPSRPQYFSCQRCGQCCSGKGGIVVGPSDLPRLADLFQLSEEEFLRRHTEKRGGKPVLKIGDDGFCEFFEKGKGCAIHPARPNVCRAWPYFRGNLVDDVSFYMAKEDCPGIADCKHHEFAQEGYSYLKAHKLLGTDPSVDGRAVVVQPHELPEPRLRKKEN